MKTPNSQQGSITLGLVFGLGMLGLGIAAATMTFSTAAISNNSTAAQGVGSLVTADAATREGVYRAIDSVSGTNVTFTGASIPLLNNSDTAAVTVAGSWPLINIHGAADNARTTRKVVATLDLFPSAFAFDQAVYTHGDLEITGSGEINGDVYATDGIEISDSGSEVNGNANSPQAVDDPHHGVTGNSDGNHPEILPPEIDTTDYFNEANTNSTYFTNPVLGANAIKNTTTHGTYYIVGDTNIQGNNNTTYFNGTLIVEGTLTLRGGNYSAEGSNPLVIYVTGDLILGGGVTINGIAYVEGETSTANGNAEVNGSLISVNNGNSMSVSGSLDITYDPNYAEAWREIIGLDTESGTDPMVKNWHEE